MAADLINQRVRKGSATEALERLINQAKSRIRARVEHGFGVAKPQWGFSKLRYPGLAKNATGSIVALGLANASTGAGSSVWKSPPAMGAKRANGPQSEPRMAAQRRNSLRERASTSELAPVWPPRPASLLDG